MKKIILVLTFLSFGILSSCSSDDDNSSENPTSQNTVTAKVNGVLKNFSPIVVDQVVYPEYTDLEVTATIAGTTPVTIEMSIEKNGTEGAYFFQYTENGVYYQTTETFSIIVTQNSENKLVGTFSGTLVNSADIADTITVTEGVFTISY